MEGVRAEDSNDGDMTDKIIVDTSDVDYLNPGRYKVIYTVADQAGNLAEIRAAVNVQELVIRTTVIDDPVASGDQEEKQVMNYVINKNTGVFHYPDCKSVSQIKVHIRMDIEGTREEVIDKYRPCGNCHP